MRPWSAVVLANLLCAAVLAGWLSSLAASSSPQLRAASERVGVSLRYVSHGGSPLGAGNLVGPGGRGPADGLEGLLIALEHYPRELRTRLLREIVLTDFIPHPSLALLGSAHCKQQSITLVLPPSERTVHREMAHLAFCDAEFPHARWKDVSPYISAHTRREVLGLVQAGDRAWVTERLHRRGYLNRLAASSPDEDFAAMAAAVYSPGRELDSLCSRFPKLRRKRDRVLEVYDGLGEARRRTSR
jgi:hypothetical protein